MAGWKFFKGTRENWFSHELYNWMDAMDLPASAALPDRCNPSVIRRALEPYTDMFLEEIRFVPEGTWKEKGKPLLDNVPAFYFVRIKEFLSGIHIADLRVFLPLRWNRRFMGIAGAGTNMETDWDKEQTTNLTSWPMAVRNGFACVVSDGATGMFVDNTWGFKDGDLDWQMIRNWAFEGTHNMTVTAKAVVEACYGETIYKSYMHGTSGGGRQIIQWPVGPRQFGYLKLHPDKTITEIPFAVQFLRWLIRDPDWDFSSCSYQEFEQIYMDHKEEFGDFAFYGADLRRFALRKGKLMITHGTGDHVSPNQLTGDYYLKALQYFDSEKELKETLRVFFPEHGGHALFDWDGPNVTNASGMKALMDWVEKDLPPERLRTVNYDFEKDRLIRESCVDVFHL